MRKYLLFLLAFLCFLPQIFFAASASFPTQENTILIPKEEKREITNVPHFMGLVKSVVNKQVHKIQALSLKNFTLIAGILSVFVLAACVYFAIKLTKKADLGKGKPYVTAILAILYSLIYLAILGVLTDVFYKKKEEVKK